MNSKSRIELPTRWFFLARVSGSGLDSSYSWWNLSCVGLNVTHLMDVAHQAANKGRYQKYQDAYTHAVEQ